MPKLLLTKRNIDSKKHIPPVTSGQVDYFDEDIKGLLLRVGKSSKTFYVQVDVKDPVSGKFKTIKEKIGAYGEYTPEQVRAMAPDIIRRIREGRPKEEKPATIRDIYERYLTDKKLTKGTLMLYKIVGDNGGCWLYDTAGNELVKLSLEQKGREEKQGRLPL